MILTLNINLYFGSRFGENTMHSLATGKWKILGKYILPLILSKAGVTCTMLGGNAATLPKNNAVF